MHPRVTRYVVVRIQDYAADAFLRVYKEDDFRVRDYQQIPENFRRFWSSADPDSDGFTNWEEYRGFIQGCGSWSCHERTDSLWSNLFIDDQSGLLDIQAAHCATGYNIELETNWPVLDSLNRHWLDFMFARTDYLTDPGYNPPDMNFLDQVVNVIIEDTVPRQDTLGMTPHFSVNGILFRGPSGNSGAILINLLNHFNLVNHFMNFCGLPEELSDQVFEKRLIRTSLHELGHSFGINHHSPDSVGSHDCVMKYEVESDYFPWDNYTWGVGYLSDDWNCSSEKGLRP